MKKSKLFPLGILITGMAFSLVLAGCASTTAAEDPTAEELAAQLAADINAIEEGKAVVNGDTVTLTGGVRLETALTVPEGVTLDLTKETLQVGGNAIFTVNGTVNAKAEGVNVDSAAANPATINGNGTISLKSKGRMLGIWEGKKLTLDGVTLVGLKDNDKPLVEMSNGGEFVMKSGAITGNTITGNDWVAGGGVKVNDGGKFTMSGGAVTGNNALGTDGGSGGGVEIWNGEFTMTGGTILGNTVNREGGGVRVGGESAIFTMEGGEITGNTITNGEWSRGGGVRVQEGARFILKGGEISENTTQGTRGGFGGGVNISNGEFTMEGGEISGNTTQEKEGGTGGGVAVSGKDATFTMQDGAIMGNSTQWGGGVNVTDGATFILKGGEISENSAQVTTAANAYGGGVKVDGGSTFTMQGGKIFGNTAKGGGWADGGGVNIRGNDTVFTMQGGEIFGNSVQNMDGVSGGGVSVFDDGVFIMEGGRIQGNTDSDGFAANTASSSSSRVTAALDVGHGNNTTAKWGTGGIYTKGGVPQTEGSDIGSTDNTLIAMPTK
jgi:hypothetical protein